MLFVVAWSQFRISSLQQLQCFIAVFTFTYPHKGELKTYSKWSAVWPYPFVLWCSVNTTNESHKVGNFMEQALIVYSHYCGISHLCSIVFSQHLHHRATCQFLLLYQDLLWPTLIQNTASDKIDSDISFCARVMQPEFSVSPFNKEDKGEGEKKYLNSPWPPQETPRRQSCNTQAPPPHPRNTTSLPFGDVLIFVCWDSFIRDFI